MANPEPLKILKQGVAVWNAWRKENPSEIPELCAAGLNGEMLRSARLEGANLCFVKVGEANLVSARRRGKNGRDSGEKRCNEPASPAIQRNPWQRLCAGTPGIKSAELGRQHQTSRIVTLRLSLHREYFAQIAAGTKWIDYRNRTPYWRLPLWGPLFSSVVFSFQLPDLA